VIVLEKRGAVGGNTAISSGPFASDSPAQKRDAIDARTDHFFEVAVDFAHWKLDPRVLRAFLDKSGDTIRWLEQKGLFFDVKPMYPNQIPVWHLARPRKWQGGNLEVVKLMEEECLRHGVEFHFRTPAKKLLTGPDGEITAVVAENKRGELVISTKNVIIATGGFGGNKTLLKKHSEQYRSNMICAGILHTGDGFLMAAEVGADTEGLGMLLLAGPQIPTSLEIDIGEPPDLIPTPMMALTLEPDTIWVNKLGLRYADEVIGYNHFVSSNAVNRQPDNLTYTLMDYRMVKAKEAEGLIIGQGPHAPEMRTGMPGLERELLKQAEGWMKVMQVDRQVCNGCGNCVQACGVEAISLDTVADDANEYSPCRAACPAGVDMRRYFNLLNIGESAEAYRVLREYLPLPAVTGRVCPHYCELECARRDVDEAVNINGLERYVADFWLDEKAERIVPKYKAGVAVVGSGPAGLSCAYFLARMGYPVTVYEALDSLGGMLRAGIPQYRLPRGILDQQINYIKDMGVRFKTGVAVGKDITLEALQKESAAVFFAVGCQLSKRLELEGSDLEGVLWGLDYLRDSNSTRDSRTKGNVVVVGGGNVAMDVALTALRRGASQVRVVCLESGSEIPAYPEELDRARAEGISIYEGWGPARIINKGSRVAGIELKRCTQVCEPGGAFNPLYDERVTKNLEADMIILAVGQAPDSTSLHENMRAGPGNYVQADPVTLETSLAGVFGGGDVLGGAGSVVKAVADGKNAAISIDRYIKGEDLVAGREVEPPKVANPPKDGMRSLPRTPTAYLAVGKSKANFDEVKLGFDEEQFDLEVQRCMTCGSKAVVTYHADCRLCHSCETSCPQHALSSAPTRKIEPYVKIADSWDEIAAWMDADPGVLKSTVEEYNQACEKGLDSLFAKDRKYLTPLDSPPYFAIQANSDFLDTLGGLKVNEHMQVIDKRNRPILGLYAAGSVAGGWEGESYNVILSGAASGFALNSGRIAGETAAARIVQAAKSEPKTT